MSVPPRPEANPSLKAWISGHKAISAAIAFVLFVVVVGALSDGGRSSTASRDLATVEPSDEVTPEESQSFPPPSSQAPPPTVTLKDLSDKSFGQAKASLRQAGLAFTVEQDYSREAKGTVLGTDPAPGADLEVGSVVVLTVAEPYPTVPNVVGASLSQARSKLKQAGYSVRVVKAESSQPAGTVIAVSPSAGSDLVPGKIVKVTVAKAPAPTCDPNYSGYCVPIVSYDLDCANVGTNFRVVGYDKHGFDGDNDGWACET